MKLILQLLAGCATLLPAGVIVNFDEATKIGQPGQTVTFIGTVQNTSLDGQRINSVALNTAPELNGDSGPFFVNGLIFLNPSFLLLPEWTSSPFALFDVEIPLGTAPGIYTLNNDFALFGGLTDTDFDLLGSAGFTVVVENPVPEPSTWGLLLAGGLTAAVGTVRKKTRRSWSEAH